MSGRDLKSWIGRAEQKALLRAIAAGGPQHFALTEYGAKLAWLVDPYGRKVYVYSRGVAPLTVSDSTVRGTGPVEGFVLDLTRVWRGFRV